VVIEGGPAEFAAMLRKRAFVPPKSLWHRPKRPIPAAPSLKRPNASQAGRLLEDEGILTCPNGHPVNGRSLFIAECDPLRRPPPRNLVCARCLKPVFPPMSQDQLDEMVKDIKADVERKRSKQARREAKKKPTDVAVASQQPLLPGRAPTEQSS
jgi:hypothetical protein